MDLKSKRHRLMTVVATGVVFGVLGLSLSVVAFGQSTTTTPLGNYTSTVPTSTTPGDYTQTVPTATTPAQVQTTPTTTTSTPSAQNNSATTPQSEAAPQTATGTSPNVAAAPTGTTPKALAFTGFNPLPLLIVGLLLVGAGAFVQLRRRRDV
jgi:LPXTG-motif cell wall-anchored protein